MNNHEYTQFSQFSQTYKVSHSSRLESNNPRLRATEKQKQTEAANTEAAHEQCGVVACPGLKPQGGSRAPGERRVAHLVPKDPTYGAWQRLPQPPGVPATKVEGTPGGKHSLGHCLGSGLICKR